MPIPTTVTIEQTFQVLDPITVVPPGSTVAQFVEAGITQIPFGSNVLNIVFQTVKASDTYNFDELLVKNTIDPSPLELNPPMITAANKFGFTAAFNGNTDTSAYFLIWGVRILT